MADTTEMVPWTDNIPQQFRRQIEGVMHRLSDIAPKSLNMTAFSGNLAICFVQTPGLIECIPDTVAEALIKIARLGLIPGQEAYLVPYNNKKRGGKICTPIIGFHGWMRLLNESPMVSKVVTNAVFSKDSFEIDELSDTMAHKRSMEQDRGKLTHTYCCVWLTNGQRIIEVLNLSDIEKRKSRAYRTEQADSPWNTDPIEMARKSAVQAWCGRNARSIVSLTDAIKMEAEAERLTYASAPPQAQLNEAMDTLFSAEYEDVTPPPILADDIPDMSGSDEVKPNKPIPKVYTELIELMKAYGMTGTQVQDRLIAVNKEYRTVRELELTEARQMIRDITEEYETKAAEE